jgi:hypothetical protein
MPLSNQELMEAIASLAMNQNNLQTTFAALLENMSTNKNVAKPQNYDGKQGEEARRFLASFELYANSIPSLKNHQKRIPAAISFLTGDAALWATTITEAINHSTEAENNNFPYHSWEEFIEAFKARFETADAEVDAKEFIKHLYQGRDTVAKYAATFKQYAERTGYSGKDLRDRFYDHLANRIKDALVYVDKPIGTLKELEMVAISIDNRQVTRAKEKGRNIVNYTSPSHAPASSTIPARDPNAMDIDATHTGGTEDSYRQHMRGRCYGCGSHTHRKADGHHEKDTCGHCGLTGHLASVCRRKFLGLAKKNPLQAAATSTIAPIANPAPTASVAATPDLGAMLRELAANQKSLADQIAEMKKGF